VAASEAADSLLDLLPPRVFTFGRLGFLSRHPSRRGSRRGSKTQLRVGGLLSDTAARLVDAETGQRGFLLTGDDAYLEPYHAAIKVSTGS